MSLSSGMGGRWAIGAVILVHVVVYNETGGATTVLAALITTSSALLSAYCRAALANVQLPYLRATQRFDFFCLFLALWMDLLALLAVCGALARTLSTCMDAMSGGMARIYLLGRNSPENEPWPDVLGVSVVFLLTVMFMLGLENTKVFGVLMTIGAIGMSVILIVLSGLRGRSHEWKAKPVLAKGLYGLLTSAALINYSFPKTITTSGGTIKRCLAVSHMIVIGGSLALSAGCLSTITQFNDHEQTYIAVPIMPLLEKQDFHSFQPAVACLLVLACSGAYLELFPEMYSVIVQLTTADWRILPRQIGYESPDSGSPVLAIFTGASLCAMLAFACPLQNLVYILAASHLVACLIRAVYLLYSPRRPKFVISTTNDITSAYSRLDAAPSNPAKCNPTTASRSSSIWCFLTKPKSMSLIPTSKSMLKKAKRSEELEREWLLLGEPPQSPRVAVGGSGVTEADAESNINCPARMAPLSDVEILGSDKEDEEDDDSESTTDIDAIVDEYRQKVKVSTAGPMEKMIRLPTTGSWQLTLLLMTLIFVGLIVAAFGSVHNSGKLFVSGTVAVISICISMEFLPKYAQGPTSVSAFTCGLAILLESLLLTASLVNSWPAIVFWMLAGLALYLRCDKWCCGCFDQPRRRSRQQLLTTTVPNMTSIRIPCPPRGSMISSRISGHR